MMLLILLVPANGNPLDNFMTAIDTQFFASRRSRNFSKSQTKTVQEKKRKKKKLKLLKNNKKVKPLSFENRIIERTFYPPIVEYLNKIGFDCIGESKVGTGASDVVFRLNEQKFVVETKLGKETTTLSTKAVAQAFRYANKLGTSDVIILIYPDSLRNQPIPDSKWLTDITLHKKIKCHIFTEYWNETIEETPAKVFDELKNKISTKTRKVDLNHV